MPRVYTTRKPKNKFQAANDAINRARRRNSPDSFEAFCLAQHSRLMLKLQHIEQEDQEFLGPGDGLNRYTRQRETAIESRGITIGCQSSDYAMFKAI